MDYKCNKNSNCSITTQTRSLCQLCRYKKCKLFGLNIKSRLKQPSQSIRLENCLICNSESSGIHFGVLSCEGCKVCLKIIKELFKNYFQNFFLFLGFFYSQLQRFKI